MPASTKRTGKTNEDRPPKPRSSISEDWTPNRNVQKVGVHEADPVNADIIKKIIICKICHNYHKDENVLLIHLLMFHFKVSTGYF